MNLDGTIGGVKAGTIINIGLALIVAIAVFWVLKKFGIIGGRGDDYKLDETDLKNLKARDKVITSDVFSPETATKVYIPLLRKKYKIPTSASPTDPRITAALKKNIPYYAEFPTSVRAYHFLYNEMPADWMDSITNNAAKKKLTELITTLFQRVKTKLEMAYWCKVYKEVNEIDFMEMAQKVVMPDAWRVLSKLLNSKPAIV